MATKQKPRTKDGSRDRPLTTTNPTAEKSKLEFRKAYESRVPEFKQIDKLSQQIESNKSEKSKIVARIAATFAEITANGEKRKQLFEDLKSIEGPSKGTAEAKRRDLIDNIMKLRNETNELKTTLEIFAPKKDVSIQAHVNKELQKMDKEIGEIEQQFQYERLSLQEEKNFVKRTKEIEKKKKLLLVYGEKAARLEFFQAELDEQSKNTAEEDQLRKLSVEKKVAIRSQITALKEEVAQKKALIKELEEQRDAITQQNSTLYTQIHEVNKQISEKVVVIKAEEKLRYEEEKRKYKEQVQKRAKEREEHLKKQEVVIATKPPFEDEIATLDDVIRFLKANKGGKPERKLTVSFELLGLFENLSFATPRKVSDIDPLLEQAISKRKQYLEQRKEVLKQRAAAAAAAKASSSSSLSSSSSSSSSEEVVPEQAVLLQQRAEAEIARAVHKAEVVAAAAETETAAEAAPASS